jgi:integrase
VAKAAKSVLPLAPETVVEPPDHYLRLERPAITDTAVFVSRRRVARVAHGDTGGLRSLFRHHRITTGVVHANPHRFRHTSASDMIRAGVSLL